MLAQAVAVVREGVQVPYERDPERLIVPNRVKVPVHGLLDRVLKVQDAIIQRHSINLRRQEDIGQHQDTRQDEDWKAPSVQKRQKF